MKIEFSDVQVEAQSKSELSSSSETSFEFKQTLLGFVEKEGEEAIPNNQNTDIVQQTEEMFEEEKEEIKRELARLMLELILIQFLGVNPKSTKSQTLKFDCFEACEQKQSPQKIAVMQTEFKHERTIEYRKKDSVDYSSKAIIKTQNEDFEINLNISYTKEFYEKHEERIEFSEVSYLDPLVIQYSKEASSLDYLEEDLSFTFDIDANGESDTLAQLKEGNGFLALDKNSNGKIDDGAELFGPNTNDAFGELREFDSDENNWIDENDPIFNDLKIWRKNSDGEDELFALGDSEIGAIYLKDASTDIDINKNVKDPLAHLKSTSFFVREDGSAGLLSSLDFVS